MSHDRAPSLRGRSDAQPDADGPGNRVAERCGHRPPESVEPHSDGRCDSHATSHHDRHSGAVAVSIANAVTATGENHSA
jgi:hypothetical protein